jgi:dCTP deaminase
MESTMSVLGRKDILEALADTDLDQRLIVTPLLDPGQVGRGAIDLRLGTEFLLLRRTRNSGLRAGAESQQEIDAMQERVVVPFGEELWLHPRHFVLAAALEFIVLPNDISAYVVGRSSWGRLGLIVATAVYVQPGFHGCLTFELVNEGDSPICLTPGTRVAQLVLHRLENASPARHDEGDKYLAPVRPQASKLSGESDEFAKMKRLGDALRSRLG